MSLIRTFVNVTGLVCVISIGCGGQPATGPVAGNPYDVSAQHAAVSGPGPRQPNRAAAAPGDAPPSNSRAAVAAKPQQTSRAPSRSNAGNTTSPRPRTIAIRRPQQRDSGSHAVQLSLSEYSRMARSATDMLHELTEIHIAVDESGDASGHQDRWGELTADLTELHRQVLATGYPPQDVANHLQETWLPALDEAIAKSKEAVANHTSVESGFEYCLQEAEAIRDHLQQTRDDG